MANRWIDYVYNETDYRGSDLAVAQKLADAANRDTDKCQMKIETLSKQTRLSARQVKRVLAHLEADGFVEIKRFQGRGLQPEFRLQKVTSATPFKDRKKVTSDAQKGDKKVTSATVKGDICDTQKVTSATPHYMNPFIEPCINPEEEEPRELFLGNGLIPDTEELVGFSINLFTQERILEVVTDFVPEWLQLVKNRMVGLQGAHRNEVSKKMGYWLDDYQRNLWRFRKDRETQNATPKPTSEREKSASRILAGYQLADRLEAEARAELETLRLNGNTGSSQDGESGERSGTDGHGTRIEGQGLVRLPLAPHPRI